MRAVWESDRIDRGRVRRSVIYGKLSDERGRYIRNGLDIKAEARLFQAYSRGGGLRAVRGIRVRTGLKIPEFLSR